MAKKNPSPGVKDIRLSLEGSNWEATVDPGTGSLSSLILDLGTRREILYDSHRKRQSGWRGLAPWLWPAVGRTLTEAEAAEADQKGVAPSEGHYRLKGKLWKIPIHGFAMTQPWVFIEHVQSKTRSWAVCQLEDSAETRRCYPFRFRLSSTLTVHRSFVSLSLDIHASEKNEDPMPFSVGNHLTYDVIGGLSSSLKEAQLFSPCQTERPLRACGLLRGDEVSRRLAGLPLSQMTNGVVSGFPNLEPRVDVAAGPLRIRVSQREVPGPSRIRKAAIRDMAFVFYGDEKKGFFCPEPWLGYPNSLNTGEGLISLSPGESFTWELQIHWLSDPYLAE